jgi:hypothetical protein
MCDTGVQKQRVRKHDLGAVRTNEDASDLSQLSAQIRGAGHDGQCRREDDDLPDESI